MTSGHMTSGHTLSCSRPDGNPVVAEPERRTRCRLRPGSTSPPPGATPGLGHVWVGYYTTPPPELAPTAAANLEMDPASRSAVRTVVNRHYIEFLRPLLDEARTSGQLRPDADVEAFLALLMLMLPHV